jgi:drug/metabolite transporter (DMT)-like permease
VWLGIVIALIGVLVLTGIDLTVSARALFGDLLALVGAMFAAGYVTAGAVVRRHVSTATYTTVCYGVCAFALLVVCLSAGVALSSYEATDWLKLAALTAGPQLLGHTIFNHVLRTTSATLVSLAILLEVPIAAVLAALWLGQTPPPAVLPAAALLLAGIAVVVGSGTSADAPRSVPVE